MSQRRPIKKEIRERVKQRFGGKCGYCGQEAAIIHVDHIWPVERAHQKGKDFDVNHESNLMPACLSCNNYKHVWCIDMFRSELTEQVKRARENSINFRLAERFGLIKETEAKVVFFFEKELNK